MDYLRRTWADIDLDAIAHNYNELKKRVSDKSLTMAVVKADAYGHGDGYVSRVLQEEGADWFGVSNINEAISLRRQGIEKPILILGFTPPELVEKLAELSVTQALYCGDYARSLSDAAVKHGVCIDCHVKIDTGMTRIGFYAQQHHEQNAADEIVSVCGLPGLDCTGVFTHFAVADEFSDNSVDFTKLQFQVFTETIRRIESAGVAFRLRHCCNSAGALAYPEMHLDMVRLGNVLYGLAPSSECAGMADLRPAMSLYTTVTMVKELEEGVTVSYGRRYATDGAGKKIASIAVGYADGYRRSFTNRGRVIIRGSFAPIAGTVCMDQSMVDVTGIDGVAPGDVVTLVGKSDGNQITLDDFAQINGTINYEEACLIGRRVPRVYIRGGREIAAVDYVISTLK